MPRYIEEDTISFTDIDGNRYPIKDMREFPTYVDAFTFQLIGNEELDEIASRRDVYGDDGENLSYKIVEHNKALMVDYKFNLTKMKELKIPV